jgi:hypothetical protein
MTLYTFEISEASSSVQVELEDGAVLQEAARQVNVLFAAQTAAKWIGGHGRMEVTDPAGKVVHTLLFEETDDLLVRSFSQSKTILLV